MGYSRSLDGTTARTTCGRCAYSKLRLERNGEELSIQTKGHLIEIAAAAPIFARAGGGEWNKDAWKHPIKGAVTAARLPDAVSAYTLRHSVITPDPRALADPDCGAGTSVAIYQCLIAGNARQAMP